MPIRHLLTEKYVPYALIFDEQGNCFSYHTYSLLLLQLLKGERIPFNKLKKRITSLVERIPLN